MCRCASMITISNIHVLVSTMQRSINGHIHRVAVLPFSQRLLQTVNLLEEVVLATDAATRRVLIVVVRLVRVDAQLLVQVVSVRVTQNNVYMYLHARVHLLYMTVHTWFYGIIDANVCIRNITGHTCTYTCTFLQSITQANVLHVHVYQYFMEVVFVIQCR